MRRVIIATIKAVGPLQLTDDEARTTARRAYENKPRLTTGEIYTARLSITGNRQVYLPVEIQKMLEGSGKISPSLGLYPPACMPYGLEAELEAASRSWAVEVRDDRT